MKQKIYNFIRVIVLLAFKLKKPTYVYRYTEECWGTPVDSEYLLETKILFLSFTETYTYGAEEYHIGLVRKNG